MNRQIVISLLVLLVGSLTYAEADLENVPTEEQVAKSKRRASRRTRKQRFRRALLEDLEPPS